MPGRTRLLSVLATVVLLLSIFHGTAPVFAANDRPVTWESGDQWAGAPGWNS